MEGRGESVCKRGLLFGEVLGKALPGSHDINPCCGGAAWRRRSLLRRCCYFYVCVLQKLQCTHTHTHAAKKRRRRWRLGRLTNTET